MNKAILIGNGFSGTVKKAFHNEQINNKLRIIIGNEVEDLNNLFEPFRLDVSDREISHLVYGLYPSDNLFPSEHLFPRDTEEVFDSKIKAKIFSILNELDIDKEYFQTIFIESGLIYEVSKNKIENFESLYKVCELFNYENKAKVINASNEVIHNNGDYGLNNIENVDIKKLATLLSEYVDIFTTNYDLILDDLLMDEEINHIHGSFHIKKIPKNYNDYEIVRTDERLDQNSAYLVMGVNGFDKQKKLKTGVSYSYSYPYVYPGSILDEYLKKLKSNKYDEIHIFGYSGENDQHINNAITYNNNIKKIIYYIDPNNLNDKDFKERIQLKFKHKITTFTSWNKIWERIN